MPKYDLIEEEIKWCEEHRNPAEEVYQDGFIAGLRHALFLMRSRPTQGAADGFSPWAGDDDQGDGIGFAEAHGW